MKKVFLALAVIAACASFASCKKTCECTVTVLGVSTSYEVNLDDVKKDDSSIKRCKDLNNSGVTVSGTNLANATCK